MTEKLMLWTITVPAISGAVVLLLNRERRLREGLTLLATLSVAVICFVLYGRELTLPWSGFGIPMSFRLYNFSSFILLFASLFAFLISLYSTAFMSGKPMQNQYYSYLLFTLAFVNGAVLANHILLLLFFWEGLLVVLYGMIFTGGPDSHRTAMKAFIITGITDVCLMVGLALTARLAGTMEMSAISLPLRGMGSFAFIMLMIGAISKAGSMPFHSWIPDAARDAPLPFMALVPGSLEKLLGIYLLCRATMDLFRLTPQSWLCTLMMITGALTLLFAVMMALVQTDYKRLLAYHAVSQVGYMILGIGTAMPAGIIGGIFHMVNHALYKSCLFLTAGAVERQAGTTDIKKLGGLSGKMPLTFTCFFVAAAAISGVPPFNGFFSKELVYEGALERSWVFYAAALLGSFLTAASFLKLGHAVYLGRPPEGQKQVMEAPASMLAPMAVLASLCIMFGLYNVLPIQGMIQPILGEHRLEGHSYGGLPSSAMLVLMTLAALAGAYLNHLYGVEKSGRAYGAADHIHNAPGLSVIYEKAGRRCFDPYDQGMKLLEAFAKAMYSLDRAVDWLYGVMSVRAAQIAGGWIRTCHTGSYALYIIWSLLGTAAVILIALAHGN